MKGYIKNSLKAIVTLGIAGGLIFSCADDDRYSSNISGLFSKYKRNAVYKRISDLKGDKQLSLNETFGDKTITMETNWRGTEIIIKIKDSKTGSTIEMADETDGMYAEVEDKPDSGRYYFGGINSVSVDGKLLPMQKLGKEKLDELEKRFDDAASMILERYEKSIDAKVEGALKSIDDTKISQEAK